MLLLVVQVDDYLNAETLNMVYAELFLHKQSYIESTEEPPFNILGVRFDLNARVVVGIDARKKL